MPKKVDHDAYRLELATRAAELFSEQGFSGLGMRQIASELGISKSALYHYFPTKQALFHACTDVATSSDSNIAPEKGNLAALFEMFSAQEDQFPKEMSLLWDYLRGKDPKEIAEDETMALANGRYLDLVEQYVGKRNAKPVLCLLMGTLLQSYLDGGQTQLSDVERWLKNRI